jgi:hypothetical protein
MGYPQFNLRNSPLPPIEEPPFPTAAEIAFHHEMKAELRRLAEQRAEHAALFLYKNPLKPMRFSKSGVPLVKELSDD